MDVKLSKVEFDANTGGLSCLFRKTISVEGEEHFLGHHRLTIGPADPVSGNFAVGKQTLQIPPEVAEMANAPSVKLVRAAKEKEILEALAKEKAEREARKAAEKAVEKKPAAKSA
jgi:hypothetical protein